MRVAVTIGKFSDGSFKPLALPDKDVVEQRAMVREIITAGGVIGKGKDKKKLVEVLYFDKVERSKKF